MGNSASQEPAIVDGDLPAITEAAPSGMVERVALAMCRYHNRYLDDEQFRAHLALLKRPGGVSKTRIWDNWLSEARAAIEAMREPTRAMEDAGANSGMAEPVSDDECEIFPGRAWQAMIDEALSEAA